jgi:hypothetical protein
LSVWLNYIQFYFGENYTIQLAHHLNEDGFISQVIAKDIKDFRIAPVALASQFAFEVKPRYLYQMNKIYYQWVVMLGGVMILTLETLY